MENTAEMIKSPVDAKLDELESLILSKQNYIHSNVEKIGSIVGQLQNQVENHELTSSQTDRFEKLEEQNELNLSTSGVT